jgi:phospholipase C
VSTAPPSRIPLSEEDRVGLEHREQIEHIVVLMLENRSFDHMLGYLSLPAGQGGSDRVEVDGLSVSRDDANLYNGIVYPPFPLGDRVEFRDPDGFDRGPDHSAYGIDQQLRDGNGGFVCNYAAPRARDFPVKDLKLPMGYYTGAELYAYDFLARNFCVSDRWFCSTPGATMPNRLYAATGRCARSRNASVPPVYSLPSIVRHLDAAGCDWAWFAHAPFASLWTLDLAWAVTNRGRAWHHLHPFDSHTKQLNHGLYLHLLERAAITGLHWVERRLREFMRPHDELLEIRPTLAAGVRHGGETFASLAESDNLPQVSFIDPLFVDVGPALDKRQSAATNDDHPPSNVLLGQNLVRDTVRPLVESDAWPNTLLIVTYDEHGGFHDHVMPPDDVPDEDIDPQFHRLGPRVPTFVVSPRVAKGSVAPARSSSSDIPPDHFYDHTSILKTVLARFCLDRDGAIPDMGERVNQARHVFDLLNEPPRDDLVGYEEFTHERPTLAGARDSLPPEEPTELQREYQQAALTVLTLQGLLDPGQLHGLDCQLSG